MRSVMVLCMGMMLAMMMISSGVAYDVPPRKIEIKPYVHLLFPKDLVTYETGVTYVEDKTGFGGGVKIRVQVSGPFGFVINSSVTGIERSYYAEYYDWNRTAIMFTGGIYYAFETTIGNITLDCGYGAIEVCSAGLALFLPSVEYSYPVSDRVSLAAELSLPIPNDWYSDWNHESNAKSLMLSVGSVFLF